MSIKFYNLIGVVVVVVAPSALFSLLQMYATNQYYITVPLTIYSMWEQIQLL